MDNKSGDWRFSGIVDFGTTVNDMETIMNGTRESVLTSNIL